MTAFFVAMAISGNVAETFQHANEDYFRGDFAGAAAGYRHVIDAGVGSADLYYNLGNAELRAGRIGSAIWSYERALALAPGDEEITWNLAAARRQAETRWRDRFGGEFAEPWWTRVVRSTDGGVLTTGFAVTYCSVFLMLLFRRVLSRMSRAVAGAAAGLLGVAALCLGVLVLARGWDQRFVRRAIVVSDEVGVVEGPDDRARVSFRIHGGLKLRIMEQDDSWLRVRLPNGLEGWVRNKDVGLL